MERAEAEAIYERGRDAVVEVLLALSAQNERLTVQVEALTARVARQDERIVQLERKARRSSRNSSQPPSQDRPGAPPRRGKDPSGRKQGAQSGHEGKGRELLPTSAVDEVVEHWPMGWVGFGDEFEEVQELGLAVTVVAAIGHRPGRDLQSGEQRCGPVALVVVGGFLG